MNEAQLQFLLDSIKESAVFCESRIDHIMDFQDVCDQELETKYAYSVGYDMGFNEGKVALAKYLVRLINDLKEEGI